MQCFSLAYLEQLFVWVVIVCAIIAIIRLLLPYVLGQLGAGGGIIMAAINIVMWAVIAIAVIYCCFMLISCLGGGLSFPALPTHR
jgi:hypothetical protein